MATNRTTKGSMINGLVGVFVQKKENVAIYFQICDGPKSWSNYFDTKIAYFLNFLISILPVLHSLAIEMECAKAFGSLLHFLG